MPGSSPSFEISSTLTTGTAAVRSKIATASSQLDSTAPPEQDGKVALHELQVALGKLAPDQREALVLVAVERVSYEDAAAICGVPVGTVKSWVNRARAKLAELLDFQWG